MPLTVLITDLQTAGRGVLAQDGQAAVIMMGAIAQLPCLRRLFLIGIVDEAQRQRRFFKAAVEMILVQIKRQRRHSHQPAGQRQHGVKISVDVGGQAGRLRRPEISGAGAVAFALQRHEHQRFTQIGRGFTMQCGATLSTPIGK